ncbi:hypothetical protein BSN82_07840 [Acinetobacter baylyi]|nr:hypothetical protein F952_01873 [Acinetobacter baylyi DSM 14961 = CIP 107474]KAF2373207.1 hypothetical protein BSL88_00805 [Acinetobacter baylyi]MAK29589.1 hypothetical protein [Acinetobacter sp.]KAF2374376.1 hypothetical protein BSL67_07115 [Acinetobacter baylyi]KAF2376190.1 hypothetical protein BSN81_14505 [Acinetobacter baylyi]
MKKLTMAVVAGSFALLSATAFACPKGTQLQGGTGPHHKGGKCVAVAGKPAPAKEKMTMKTDKEAAKAKSATHS